MPWPTPQDYNEAIQNPKLCFDDSELKSGQPEQNVLGLPRPITGGFASVYRMHCGQHDWAVRCFLREFTDQQQRYAAISRHLAKVRLPYIVGFEFLPKGIRVRNQWYPILKMEWVQGELLHEYIKNRLDNSSAIRELAERWYTMMKALREAGIGHGDLQHGNVLVTNGDLRLIDYDGVFVPALDGQLSHEAGHRNYQHPSRTELDFGVHLDHFAAWVIYTSLVVLSIDHRLWNQVGAGDEFILFRKEDFVDPDSSTTFGLLAKHTDFRIQELANLFRSLLYLTPKQIPALNGQPILQTTPAVRTLPAGADWLTDHVRPRQRRQTMTDNSSSSSDSYGIVNISLPTENSAWVLDYIAAPETCDAVAYNPRVIIPRITAAISLIYLIVTLTTCYLFAIPPVFMAIHLIVAGFINRRVFLYYYRKTPAVAERETLKSRGERERRLFGSLRQSIKDSQTNKRNALVEGSKKRTALTKRMSNLKGKEQAEISRTEKKLRRGLRSINNRRLRLNREEADALRKLQGNSGFDVSILNQNISTLIQAEANEMSDTLLGKQNQFVTDYLNQCRIIDAPIPGIGNKLKARLRSAGIHTAADVTYYKVTSIGVGQSKIHSLAKWRNSLITHAKTKRNMPTSLSRSEIDGIKRKYEAQKRQFENQKNDIQQRLAAEETAILDLYATKRRPLDDEQFTAQNISDQESSSIRNRYAQECASISEWLTQLATESQQIDDDISKLQKQIFDCNWRIAKIRHDIAPYKELTFRNYIYLLLFGHNSKLD